MGQRTAGLGTTRRAVLAVGGAAALGALAGCSTLDGLINRGAGKVVGTTGSAPAAFYPGRPPTRASASGAITQERDESQFFPTGSIDVKQVPATVRAEGREIDLEGWSTSGQTKAQDYNSSRSNKYEWWAGPDDDWDDDDDDGDGLLLEAIQDVELELLGHVMTAQDAVDRRAPEEASTSLDAFIDATENALRPELDKCGTGVCETIRENSDGRWGRVRTAQDAVDDGDWDTAAAELAAVEEIVLRDIERLDDELEDHRPGRPRFSDLIAYLRDEPTIAERFTVCLPDAKLPGDRGSLAKELRPGRVLAYFGASHEDGGLRAPFHDRYGAKGLSYDDDRCIQLDGPISLHRDLSCGNILSAELDTYTTANRGIVGYSTDGGAVVGGAPASADTDGKCVFVAGDGTLREPDSLDSWGSERSAGAVSVTQSLVCPVTVTPEDSPCPLPGLFFVRRIIHDDQVIFAGGWTLDDGALYEDSATLLFEEGPTEVASVTPDDIESDDYDDRIVEQFARDRSQLGSAVISTDLDDDGDGIPAALQSGEGRKGLNAVNVKVRGASGPPKGDVSVVKTKKSMALDAPIIHLAGAEELSSEEKRVHANGLIDEVREDDKVEY